MSGHPWSRSAIVVAGLVVAACGGSSDVAPRFDVQAEYAKVTAARARLASARERLDRIQARGSGPNPTAQTAVSELREAQIAFDEAYANDQKLLARFLTAALNVAPGRTETRQALDRFAGDAVANARYVLDHGADPGQISQALAHAERAYRTLGLGVPHDLASVLDEIRRTPRASPTPSTAPVETGPAHLSRRHGRRR
jgi:hypothetical protein